MKLDLVQIEWIDIDTEGGWHDLDNPDLKGFDLLPAFGLLMYKDKNLVILSTGFDARTKKFSDALRYPTSIVKKITKIKTYNFTTPKRWYKD